MTLDERRKQVRDCLRKRREKLKSEGKCPDCGVKAAKTGHTLCEDCLDDRRKRTAKKRKTAKLSRGVEKTLT